MFEIVFSTKLTWILFIISHEFITKSFTTFHRVLKEKSLTLKKNPNKQKTKKPKKNKTKQKQNKKLPPCLAVGRTIFTHWQDVSGRSLKNGL
jgi:hypothetical protein